MRSAFACSSCLALLVVTVFSRDASAEHVRWGDPYHRIPKEAPITKHPHDLQKRQETCADGLYSCSSDVGGGCCSSNYACGTSSCTATTLDPQSVTCGTLVGYYGCPQSDGGGCCQVGLICAGNNCSPPAGESITDTSCPAKYTLCPSSLGYGCCMSGLSCGATACYRTIESFTTTLTTVDASGDTTVLTRTTSSTVTPDLSSQPEASEGQAVGFKYFPTSVPKESPISSSSGGLPKSTIGGLIGGGVALLVIIIIATIFVHRRLRHNEKIESSKKTSSKGRTGRDGTTEYTVAKDENGSSTSANGNRTPRPGHDRTASQSSEGGVGYPEFGQPSSSSWGGYNVIPTSASEGARHPSIDSDPSGSYFNQRISQQTAQSAHRYSTDSNVPSTIGTPSAHGRQWSVASVPGDAYVAVPQELDSHHIPSELPGSLGGSPLNSPGLAPSPAAENRRRSSSLGTKPPLSHQNNPKRKSNSHQRGRSDSSSTGVPPQLGVLSENPEMHGFYGPADKQVGQTAAGLQSGDASPAQGGSARNSFSVQR